jgi:hypothetical protein
MAEPIDMLDVAKKLIPDIETGMPEDISKAFAEGKIKTIFRTSDSASLSSFGKTGTSGRLPGKVSPGSTYFMHEDGGIARYGRHGKGWADDRVSVGAKEATGGVFLDEAKFTKQFPEAIPSNTSYFNEGMAAGKDFNEPKIGLGIIEYDKGPAGAIRGDRYHEGHYISDIYRSSGEAEFTGFLGDKAPVNSDMNVVKTNISDINFETRTNGYGSTEGIPRLKPGSAADLPSAVPPLAPPTPVAPTPTSPTAPTEPASRLRGKGVGSPTPPPDEPASRLRGTLAGENPAAPTSPPPDNTVTAAGRKRAMVAANYDKMSDDDLLKYYEGAKANYEKQLIIDPDGKAFMPMTRDSMESAEKQLKARGIHPDDAAPSVAKASATKVTPLVDEYDTGATAAKVASGETLAEVPPVSPKRGPSDLGTPAGIKTKPGPHGVSVTPPTTPTPPITPATSPTGPTAKIVTKTQDANITAREAIRGIGEDIKATRKPGQRLMSAEGSKAMSEAVTKGIKGSRNLKMLAIGAAVGLGGYGANRIAGRGNTSDLGG